MNWDALVQSLIVMAKGMGGIFIVIITLMLILKLLTVIFPEGGFKKNK